MTAEAGRPHTGRRRNDAARAAILAAAATLMAEGDLAGVTVDAIAARAGVGRQTIYRWWPTKGAVLSDAMSEQAAAAVPLTETDSPRTDLRAFVAATFQAAGGAAPVLRAVAAEAQRDAHAAELLADFARGRRSALRSLLARIDGGADRAGALDLAVDQVFGVLWYRLLMQHADLDAESGRTLADRIAEQLTR